MDIRSTVYHDTKSLVVPILSNLSNLLLMSFLSIFFDLYPRVILKSLYFYSLDSGTTVRSHRNKIFRDCWRKHVGKGSYG